MKLYTNSFFPGRVFRRKESVIEISLKEAEEMWQDVEGEDLNGNKKSDVLQWIREWDGEDMLEIYHPNADWGDDSMNLYAAEVVE